LAGWVASLRPSGFSWASWATVDKSRIYRLSFLLLCGLSLFVGGRGFTHAAACWRPENVAISRFCVVYTIVEFALVSLEHYEVRFVSPLYWVQVLTLVQLLSTETCTSSFGRSVSTVWQRLRGEASPPAATQSSVRSPVRRVLKGNVSAGVATTEVRTPDRGILRDCAQAIAAIRRCGSLHHLE
jgi:hypothetical protein